MTEKRTVMWKRKPYRLTPHQGGWRLRSRARGDELDWHFPQCSLTTAKREALERFESAKEEARPAASTATLEDVVTAYEAMPKKAGVTSAYNNVTRLRSIVRTVHGKELDRIYVSMVGPKLWEAFMAEKQGGRLDLSMSGRKARNTAINAAVRQAAALFIPRLRPGYKERGIEIPADATVIQWLPTMRLPQPPAKEGLIEAWQRLLTTNEREGAGNERQINGKRANSNGDSTALYWTVGLARFAGLRQQEISACHRHWIVRDTTGFYVQLQDRPEEGFTSKTGEPYRALIINPEFAEQLWQRGKGPIVTVPDGISNLHWFKFHPQKWLKPFTGAARMPLHRLRGLYADDVAKLTRDAVAAHLAGIQAASDALGHTNTTTTKKSYLSDHAVR